MIAPVTAAPTPATSNCEPIDRRLLLAGLWTSTALVCAFTVLLGFYRAEVVQGVLDGRVPGESFTIDQTFLTLATVHVLLPILMIVVSLAAPLRPNRVANIVVGLLHLAPIAATITGERWVYFILFTIVEVALLLTIATVAWAWRMPVRRVQQQPCR